MPREEQAARVLRRFYTCADEMADDLWKNDRCKIPDYRDIDARALRAVAGFFGLDLPAAGNRIEHIPVLYSKDPYGAQPFQPDRLREQKAATGLVRSAACQWATEVYRNLKKHCQMTLSARTTNLSGAGPTK
jgi:hypothetical protein